MESSLMKVGQMSSELGYLGSYIVGSVIGWFMSRWLYRRAIYRIAKHRLVSGMEQCDRYKSCYVQLLKSLNADADPISKCRTMLENITLKADDDIANLFEGMKGAIAADSQEQALVELRRMPWRFDELRSNYEGYLREVGQVLKQRRA